MKLRPIKNHIIFKFVDETDSKGQFVEKTKWGLVITGHFDDSAKRPRWVDVVEVGPDCKEVKPGQQALVHALKWTFNFKFNDEKLWRTDETQVAAVRNSPEGKVVPLGETIIFKRHDDIVNEGKHGLQVVGDAVVDTPKGTIVSVGKECDKELKVGATIYYSEENFFSKFTHKEESLWYIDEPSVLAYEPV